ncbi:MAG: histidinol-phosphate transaminase [Gammaproteobacteria bacterium]|nr:histidinol-phosphate transaminase [Gammaproteobacteria bacterium]
MARPHPRPGILEIAAYVAGEKALPGFAEPIVLASNESALGPSPAALAAARDALARMHRYPDPGTRALNAALAAQFDLDPGWIICGSGSESLIEILCLTYAGPGDEVLFPEFSFPMYPIMSRAVGATPVTATAPGYTADVDALLAGVTERTRLVFVANPNNPTGTWIDRTALARLVAGLPEHVLLVLDCAYAEYAGAPAYDDGMHFVREHPGRIVVLRTFSKLYALAALRVGWMYADPQTIDYLMRAREVFPVSIPGEAAAIAALADADHVRRSIGHNDHWRPWLAAGLERLGIQTLPSAGNFVLARLPGAMRAADDALRERGIIVRPIGPLEGLRITVGTEAENRAVIDALAAWCNKKGRLEDRAAQAGVRRST